MTFFRLGLGAFLLLTGGPVWAATLTVGQSSVAGANTATVIPVTLSSGSGENVVAAQFDLSFDSRALSLDDVTAGASATAAGKDVSFSFPEAGTARIVVTGFNQNVISSGFLASLSLTTSATIAIGAHPLTCSELVLSDALGGSVSAVAVSGAVKAGGAVPNVVGLAQAAAQTALTSVGLVVGTVSLVYSDLVAAGAVISESPAANTHVAYGATVGLTVSRGPHNVSVPNVVGLTQTQAQNALVSAGLVLGAVTSEYSDTVVAGIVLQQIPNSGATAFSGSAVAVVLSKGPQNVPVPNVVGLTQTQAQSALVSAGLVLGSVTSEFSDSVAAGIVLQQSPSSGTTASPGSAITLVLSKGPQNVSVPNVVGLTQAQAQSVLVSAGLVLGTVTSEFSDTVAAGIVLQQSPSSGATASSGSAVALVLSKGPQNVLVPNLVGMSQTTAQNRLVEAGLSLGTVTSQFSETVVAGIVIGQVPAEGIAEAPGTAVNMVVSKGSAVISVPSVVGMTQTAAQDTIAAANLVLGTVTHEYSDSVEAGAIIRQTPAAATTANAGTQVDLVVSDGPAPGGCTGGTSKALGSGPNSGNGLLLGAVLMLLVVVRRPQTAGA